MPLQSFRRVVAAPALLAAFLLHLPAFAAEPVYRITSPDGNTLRATLEIGAAPDGNRFVRVRTTQPRSAAGQEGMGNVDVVLTVDAAGRTVRSRAEARQTGATVPLLEAERNAETGELSVRIPEQAGTLAAGAPICSALDLLAFAGRRYDWKRGGPQNFALLVDFRQETPRLVTMTLEAAGTETLTLRDGDVKARRLKISTDLPRRPLAGADADILTIGPMGEVLQAVTGLFPTNFRARGAARIEEGSMVLRLVQPAGLVVRATRNGPNGLTVKIETENGLEIGSVTTDAAYRPVRIAHQFQGRPFTAEATPTELRWRLEGTRPRPVPVTGEPWFLPHYLATEFWEKSPAFAPLAPGGKATGTYLSLEIGGATGLVFEAERLAERTLAGPDGADARLRHWRFTFATASPGTAADLWTDGARLVKMASSDGLTIVREGWEAAAALLKAPEAPRPAETTPAPKP